jgi:hypothetical protein
MSGVLVWQYGFAPMSSGLWLMGRHKNDQKEWRVGADFSHDRTKTHITIYRP